MRKYIAICVALMFALFMVAAMAQTSEQSQSSSQSQAGYPSQAPSSQSSAGQSSAEKGQMESANAKTREGCIMREESDWFLVPKRGNPIRLQASGAENPSAHEGHRVKIHGTESAISGGGASSAGTSGGTAGATTEKPPSGQPESGQAGAVASGNPPSGAGGATGTGNDLHKLADKEITVEKIDMVSETCPVNWNPKFKGESKEKGSKPGESSAPPPQF